MLQNLARDLVKSAVGFAERPEGRMIADRWILDAVIPLAKTATMMIRNIVRGPDLAPHQHIDHALLEQDMVDLGHLAQVDMALGHKPCLRALRKAIVAGVKL